MATQGDFGIVWQRDVGDDISLATTINMNVVKPDGTETSFGMEFVNDGTDGLVQYVVNTGDLDQFGIWRTEVEVLAPGFNYTTVSEDVYVGKPLG